MIDIIVILVMIGIALISYKRGLTASLFKIIGFVLSIIIALTLRKPLANFITTQTTIDDTIHAQIVKVIDHKSDEMTQEQADQAISETQDMEKEAQSVTEELPSVIANAVQEKVQETADDVKTTIAEKTATAITSLIVEILAFMILIIVTNIIILILKLCTTIFTSLPVIHEADQLGGLVYGIVEAFIIAYAILAIISIIAPLISKVDISTEINNTIFVKNLYNNNLLMKILF